MMLYDHRKCITLEISPPLSASVTLDSRRLCLSVPTLTFSFAFLSLRLCLSPRRSHTVTRELRPSAAASTQCLALVSWMKGEEEEEVRKRDDTRLITRVQEGA